MPSNKQVRLSGLGLVTCLGDSLEEVVNAALQGQRVAGRPLPLLAATPYENFLASPEPDLNIESHLDNKRLRKFMSPQAELACLAFIKALKASGLKERGVAAERIGLYAGVGLAAVDIVSSEDLMLSSIDEKGDFNMGKFSREVLPRINPLWSFHTLANMPACISSILGDIKGDNGIYSPWEDQTAFALIEAAEALMRGEVDAALVMAADTPGHPASLVELAAAGYLGEDEVASFGAACLVLERADSPPPDEARSFPLLGNLELRAAENTPIIDPLAPFIGRTVAAAPLLLIALAPALGLPYGLTGCGGHRFTFEVE